jgi:hypothetical protein
MMPTSALLASVGAIADAVETGAETSRPQAANMIAEATSIVAREIVLRAVVGVVSACMCSRVLGSWGDGETESVGGDFCCLLDRHTRHFRRHRDTRFALQRSATLTAVFSLISCEDCHAMLQNSIVPMLILHARQKERPPSVA